MEERLQSYYNTLRMPWGILFYRMVAQQLGEIREKRILDFGSGFGITAAMLAAYNDVTAVEPCAEMTAHRDQSHPYTQIIGGLSTLAEFPDQSFDCILCHNVLEYTPEREAIVRTFARLLKSDGILSIIKHNHAGRIMQKIVFENNLSEGLALLGGASSEAHTFGTIHYYHAADLTEWCPSLVIRQISGIRIFWALQSNNDHKFSQAWQDQILKAECAAADREDFRSIAFFHHVKLTF